VGLSVCLSVQDDSVRNSSQICTKFGTEDQVPDGTEKVIGAENRKSTSSFMLMRSKIQCYSIGKI